MVNDLQHEKSEQGQYKEILCLTVLVENVIPVKEQ